MGKMGIPGAGQDPPDYRNDYFAIVCPAFYHLARRRLTELHAEIICSGDFLTVTLHTDNISGASGS